MFNKFEEKKLLIGNPLNCFTARILLFNFLFYLFISHISMVNSLERTRTWFHYVAQNKKLIGKAEE